MKDKKTGRHYPAFFRGRVGGEVSAGALQALLAVAGVWNAGDSLLTVQPETGDFQLRVNDGGF
jgi:hypothetical protein